MELVRPAYGAGSLSELLPSVLAALGVPGAVDRLGLADRLAGVRRVAVLLLDGLGYRQLPLAARAAPMLADAVAGRLGELRQLTATFPSTTPVNLTSLGTGASPGEHGLVGFTVNVPGTTRVLTHIHWGSDPDPQRWQPLTTQFGAAAAAGVAVRVVSRGEFASSGLTRAALDGPGTVYLPADDPDTLAGTLLAALTGTDPRTGGGWAEPTRVLAYGYHPDVDGAGHGYGVDSRQWREAATAVDGLLARLVDGLPPDAALLVTADHGQLDVPRHHRFDLDADRRLTDGVVVVAGEPRVRYLHTVPGAAEDVVATWQGVLGEAAWVTTREQAVADGWFGPVRADHLPRIGDVAAVCRDRYAVLATAHEPDAVGRMVGFHGSWTADEMLVPLLLIRP